MNIALLSSKGQITIPKTIQKALKIGHKSKVVLYQQEEGLLIKPLHTSVVEQTAGSLKHFISKDKKGISFSRVREETQKKVAAELVQTT